MSKVDTLIKKLCQSPLRQIFDIQTSGRSWPILDMWSPIKAQLQAHGFDFTIEKQGFHDAA